MDMELNDTQRMVSEALVLLLKRHAGPARARELKSSGSIDIALGDELRSSGFLDVFKDDNDGPLTAELVTEWVAEAAAVYPIGYHALVLPAVFDNPPGGIVAMIDRNLDVPVRFAGQADHFLVLDGDEAQLVHRDQCEIEPVTSIFGYPMAKVRAGTGEALAPGAGALARRWWQIAISAEIAGTASAVLTFMQRYLSEREQFGKPLLAFQALQHRFVECHVSMEGARWLTREAAYFGAQPEAAATAAMNSAEAARLILNEAHQLAGAMGFTLEFDLHLWSLRLQALRHEAGGIRAFAKSMVQNRWQAAELVAT